ncbi:MAG: BT_3928 family protein [Rikenellaceae bacterium]
MKQPNRYSPRLKRITHIFCVIIGLTFIVSGFTKAVDPWGTAIKFDEYFAVYGLDFLLPLSRVLAVWLCGAEMMMGCMILCRVRLRLISIFALVSMVIFTAVTILSVTFFPVEECGCFGDALYLSPWQTLAKNLILLPMIITIWWRYRPDKILVYKPREVILATIFCVVTMGFSAFNYLHLPLVDFLPYKEGVNLLAEIEATTSNVEYAVVLVYRNLTTGELQEFSLDDTQWHDAQTWEWVETRTDAPKDRFRSKASDFALRDVNGDDVTLDLLSSTGKLNLLAITSLDKLSVRCSSRIGEYLFKAHADGQRTVVITPQRLSASTCELAGQSVECFNIDPTTLKSVMRATNGVVELEGGFITSKRSCIDL